MVVFRIWSKLIRVSDRNPSWIGLQTSISSKFIVLISDFASSSEAEFVSNFAPSVRIYSNGRSKNSARSSTSIYKFERYVFQRKRFICFCEDKDEKVGVPMTSMKKDERPSNISNALLIILEQRSCLRS